MQKKIILIILLPVFISLFACNPINYRKVFRDKTLCLDPWHIENASNSEYITNAENYLLSQGFDFKGISLVTGGPELDENCGSDCSCLSGTRLVLDVIKGDLEEIKDQLDFYQE